MKMKRTLVAGLLGLSLVGAAASPAMARERECRHGRGAGDGVNNA